MRVMGLDPGSRSTGYGIVEEMGGRISYISDGVISPPGGIPERLKGLYLGIKEALSIYRPEVVAVESPFLAKNVQSTMRLGQVQGVIFLAAAESHLGVYEYSPMEVKVALTGYGRASKNQVREMVKRFLSLDRSLSLDASDALAVAICHIHTAWMK